ncbi:MAG: hypothetical protein COS72_03620, partial [Candidatus Moranbacteria bacterium CG06_land_8_20_14_3_00_43_56]
GIIFTNYESVRIYEFFMKAKTIKKNMAEKIIDDTGDDLIINQLKEEIGKYEYHIKWLEENISDYKARIARSRKILKKLKN